MLFWSQSKNTSERCPDVGLELLCSDLDGDLGAVGELLAGTAVEHFGLPALRTAPGQRAGLPEVPNPARTVRHNYYPIDLSPAGRSHDL